MGQYYMPALIYEDGSVATVSAHDFGNGLKLMEHSWIGNEFVNTVYSRIADRPLRIAWIGDYSDEFDAECPESYHKGMAFKEFKAFYDAVWCDEPTKIPKSKFSTADYSIVNETAKGFLVNHNLGAFLDMGKYIRRATVKGGDWDGYCVNPLPLLTACGNGRGGGDFCQNGKNVGYEDVGVWAFDKLEYTKTRPAGFTEEEYTFIES